MNGPRWRMWDWECSQCARSGSAPVDLLTSALDALAIVTAHHGEVNPACHAAHQARWIEIFGVTTYDQRTK